MARGRAEALHYMVEAKRLAYADVARFYADPDFAAIPAGLLGDDYGAERFKLIDPAKATPEFAPGEIEIAPKLEGEGDTTYLTVVDGEGMMVSLIQSNYRGMGGGLVAPARASCSRTAANCSASIRRIPMPTNRPSAPFTPSFRPS